MPESTVRLGVRQGITHRARHSSPEQFASAPTATDRAVPAGTATEGARTKAAKCPGCEAAADRVVSWRALGACDETTCCIRPSLHPCPLRCGAPVSLDVPPGTPAVDVLPHALRPERIADLGATQVISRQALGGTAANRLPGRVPSLVLLLAAACAILVAPGCRESPPVSPSPGPGAGPAGGEAAAPATPEAPTAVSGGGEARDKVAAGSPDEGIPDAVPERVRPAALAGTWYEGDADRLSASIDGYLATGGKPPAGYPIALVAPHAGHRFSGGVAGQAYAVLQGRTYGRVFLLGPSHRMPFRGVALPTDTHFETPLGKIPVDTATVKALLAERPFLSYPEAHAEEHSIEIHLPFLQRTLPPFQLVPMVVSGLTDEEVAQVSFVLRRTIRPGDLVIASSDFTHYGPRFDYFGPPDDLIPADKAKERLQDLMSQAWQLISAREALGLLVHVRRTGDTICGALPIAVLLGVLPPGAQAHRIAMDTSGAITGDFTDSVSYLSVEFTGLWPYTSVEGAGALTDAQKRDLLKLARFTLETVVREGRKPAAEEAGIMVDDRLKELSGVFVTLKKNGELRGCIGNIAPVKPLVEGVIDNAVNAARFDRRFEPVQPEELSGIEVEVSVLTPPRRAAGVEDIILGRHGVILEKSERSAVFLPQVAPEQGWTVAEMLAHLSSKAGLSPDAWRSGADFDLFEALVFNEGE